MHQIYKIANLRLQNKDNTIRRRMVSVCALYWLCLDVDSDILKGIVNDHLPQQYTFSRKEINIDDSCDGSKLFTTVSGACRVTLGSTHLDRPGVIDFLVERHNYSIRP